MRNGIENENWDGRLGLGIGNREWRFGWGIEIGDRDGEL